MALLFSSQLCRDEKVFIKYEHFQVKVYWQIFSIKFYSILISSFTTCQVNSSLNCFKSWKKNFSPNFFQSQCWQHSTLPKRSFFLSLTIPHQLQKNFRRLSTPFSFTFVVFVAIDITGIYHDGSING